MIHPKQIDTSYSLEWFSHMHLQNESEKSKTKLIPCYEYRCTPIATCVFKICKQLYDDKDVDIGNFYCFQS